jgi:hypothetical protein
MNGFNLLKEDTCRVVVRLEPLQQPSVGKRRNNFVKNLMQGFFKG